MNEDACRGSSGFYNTCSHTLPFYLAKTTLFNNKDFLLIINALGVVAHLVFNKLLTSRAVVSTEVDSYTVNKT